MGGDIFQSLYVLWTTSKNPLALNDIRLQRGGKDCLVGSKYLRWTSRLDPFFSSWTRKFEAIASSSTVSQCCLIWNSTMTGWLGSGKSECFETQDTPFSKSNFNSNQSLKEKRNSFLVSSPPDRQNQIAFCKQSGFTNKNFYPLQNKLNSESDCHSQVEHFLHSFWCTQSLNYIFSPKIFVSTCFVRDNLCVIVLFEFIQTPLKHTTTS